MQDGEPWHDGEGAEHAVAAGAGPEAFFRLIRRRFAIANCAYVDLSTAGGVLRADALHHTFGPGWETAYIRSGYFRSDPVLRSAARATGPVDWREAGLRHADPAVAAFLDAAARHGIGPDGVAFVVERRAGRMVLVSFEAGPGIADWPAYRADVADELQLLARLLHALLGERNRGGRAQGPVLTGREADVLKWTAAGKSYWEIAVILGISERTVRHYMTNARLKLHAVSNSHAVARAMVQRLLVLG